MMQITTKSIIGNKYNKHIKIQALAIAYLLTDIFLSVAAENIKGILIVAHHRPILAVNLLENLHDRSKLGQLA